MINKSKLTSDQKQLRVRILELSFKLKLSHLGSCLSAVDLINGVYAVKKRNEKFVLSNGHAGMALYAVLEKYGYIKDAKLINELMIHPDRNPKIGIHVSTGSLGHGLPIALGMALADRKKAVYCMISDGECTEGSIWEAFRIAHEQKLANLKVVLNANGWGAYSTINLTTLKKRIKAFGFAVSDINGHRQIEIVQALKQKSRFPSLIFARTTVEQLPFLKGQDAHYFVMNPNDYQLARQLLS
ncbi:hypothetical protein A2631_01145 [Candidatus Daviesbacteria bacterium RIFCSPHIGHO2_01_FULL_44_29]|uniref:Transketolase N-terminal domain-containing protein n=1 Tax=Candidatus Daviesbacteria bacterium RIFCSPHIGHO2_02_FULL_43_12 TaxID=1797776 RepID=A0A1F5KIS4_9BACT|nr:MAG: hypothetical protein A2631_01145 [Candidatus Daviesbacteria bacterium RIFCSPHIGHO2_01_FULL_44_29]OGE40720.1 MAG: hypothetical protein A3D25_05600 [Candidatus Daviesbacteria bacterium RIFCSPHIGHO2_02_FULL_43_12]OGE69783.1 MAG: hypothetical protein A3B55_05210 [Candidatus Daviesbacteria bacterium RIFCSPLOWO2_01_FULL_43_15]